MTELHCKSCGAETFLDEADEEVRSMWRCDACGTMNEMPDGPDDLDALE